MSRDQTQDRRSGDQLVEASPRVNEPVAVAAALRGLSLRTAAIAVSALGVLIVLLFAAWTLVRPLALLIAAVAIAEAFVPLVTRLERRIPRAAAVLLVYLVVFAILGGIAWIVVPRLATQAQEFANQLPELISRGQSWIDQWDPTGNGRLLEWIQSQLSASSGALSALPFTIASTVFELVLVIAISIYWLIAAPSLLQFTLSFFPEHRRDRAEEVLSEMGQTMGGYVRGQAMVAFTIGVITYIGLLLIGVDYPLVLALVAALFEIVPILGPIIAAVPILGVALTESLTLALITLIFWIGVQQFEGYVLTPKVMQRQADIPELLVIVAIFAGGSVGGVLGALVAIPLTGALRVFVVRVAAPVLRQWTGAQPSARPAAEANSAE